jgi:hypothetical protein
MNERERDEELEMQPPFTTSFSFSIFLEIAVAPSLRLCPRV